jgi:hypothetical protein
MRPWFFKGVAVRAAIWAVTFSKDYWQEEKDQFPVESEESQQKRMAAMGGVSK